MKRPALFLLDDDPAFRRLISSNLQKAGCDVLEVPRLSVANAKYRRGTFDLLIVDGLLPDGSGIAWIEELRRGADPTPIIFVSAFWKDMRTSYKLTHDLDVAAVLAKPLAPQELVNIVWQVLTGSERPSAAPATGDEKVPEETPPAAPAAVMGDRTLAEAELRHLLESYAGALPDKWQLLTAALEQCRDQQDDPVLRDAARHRAHKLFGTAGSYGFKELSKAAAEIEEELVSDAEIDWSLIRNALAKGRRHLPKPPAPEPPDAFVMQPASVATILVIDENPAFLEEMKRFGRDMGVEIVMAQSPVDALDAAATHKIDGAIVSTHMALNHAHSGFDLVETVRDVAKHGRFPVAFAARPEEDSVRDRVEAAFTSAALYLRKPIDPQGFAELIRQFLAHESRDRARVLIIDNEAFSLLAHYHLQAEGIEVALLHDPADILTALEDFRPDLVLLDIFLPGVTGFELAHVLRMDPRWRDVAIVFVSACTDDESRVAAFKSGADDFISKPIHREDFLARIRAHLNRVRLPRSLTPQ